MKRFSNIFKMAGILVLILVLLIPLSMIESLLDERAERKNQAIEEITATWGDFQKIVGPILIVPYRHKYTAYEDVSLGNGKIEQRKVEKTAVDRAYFLPQNLNINGKIYPQKLYRGIYEAVVYKGDFQISGEFEKPDFSDFKIPENDIIWEDSILTFAITDLRGVKDSLEAKWGGNIYRLVPGSALSGFGSTVESKLKGDSWLGIREKEFSVKVNLNGGSGIRFAPLGVKNKVRVDSSWPDPGFRGAFLPSSREISDKGFNAEWEVSYYGRDYGQSWTDKDGKKFTPAAVDKSSFGVDFVNLVDFYRNVERATKYGVLFISLVFAVFFLFEVTSPIRIHAFQYILVGAGLCLFYLGLLSLSEFVSFCWSYFISAFLSTVLIGSYSWKILKGGARTWIILGGLPGIYVFLYVILQLQDYSLLVGSAGLFCILASIMYATRNIDWYGKEE